MSASETINAFRRAIYQSDLDEMRRIAASDENLFKKLRTAKQRVVLEAARESSVEAIELLVDLGADVNEQDSNRMTGLCRAVARNRPEAVEALLRKGADPDLSSPLCDILFQKITDPVRMARILVQYGADVNRPFHSEGFGTVTPLSLAKSRNCGPMVDYLRSVGAVDE